MSIELRWHDAKQRADILRIERAVAKQDRRAAKRLRQLRGGSAATDTPKNHPHD